MQNSKFKTAFAFCLLHFALLVSISFAQFGHPLKGQWSGFWGAKDAPNRILMDLTWDGKDIGGAINPGSDTAATIRKVTIDYSKVDSWAVQIEADGKDTSGKPVQIRINGTLENLGAYYRVFHGTWSQGGQKGEFTVTRN
jgi:hypothetical protein